jgi:hypothetical protein
LWYITLVVVGVVVVVEVLVDVVLVDADVVDASVVETILTCGEVGTSASGTTLFKLVVTTGGATISSVTTSAAGSATVANALPGVIAVVVDAVGERRGAPLLVAATGRLVVKLVALAIRRLPVFADTSVQRRPPQHRMIQLRVACTLLFPPEIKTVFRIQEYVELEWMQSPPVQEYMLFANI